MTKIDPNDPTKITSDSTLTVVDLKANPPAVTEVFQVVFFQKGAKL